MLRKLYGELLAKYGPQGWWPLLDVAAQGGVNPTKTGSITGYHPGDYSYPKTAEQRFEICVGAILTQNTSWINVEKALLSLRRKQALSPKGMKRLSDGKLRECIKPAGYYNQKAKKLQLFLDFYSALGNRVPTREELLELWGIGPETADSILLYAFGVPVFVIDVYTKRILLKLKKIEESATYEEIQKMFYEQVEPDVPVYQEFHALLVEEGKQNNSEK